jgi:hypothetical protein
MAPFLLAAVLVFGSVTTMPQVDQYAKSKELVKSSDFLKNYRYEAPKYKFNEPTPGCKPYYQRIMMGKTTDVVVTSAWETWTGEKISTGWTFSGCSNYVRPGHVR